MLKLLWNKRYLLVFVVFLKKHFIETIHLGHQSQGQEGLVHFPQSMQMSQSQLSFLQDFSVFVQGQGMVNATIKIKKM